MDKQIIIYILSGHSGTVLYIPQVLFGLRKTQKRYLNYFKAAITIFKKLQISSARNSIGYKKD